MFALNTKTIISHYVSWTAFTKIMVLGVTNLVFVFAGCDHVGDYIVSVCYVLVTIPNLYTLLGT